MNESCDVKAEDYASVKTCMNKLKLPCKWRLRDRVSVGGRSELARDDSRCLDAVLRFDETVRTKWRSLYCVKSSEAENLVLAHHELGLALKGRGRLSEAIISLETAVRLQPSLKTAWRDLYELRASENDVAAADAYRRPGHSRASITPD